MGPNEKKLVIRRMAVLMIPDDGDVLDGFNSLAGDITKVAKVATEWVRYAITVVSEAPDCKWKTDEDIAGAILKKM